MAIAVMQAALDSNTRIAPRGLAILLSATERPRGEDYIYEADIPEICRPSDCGV